MSYASEDAAAAERISASLRTAGIEVWLDQSELRGGEAWDRKIRKEIHDCALFIPIISANAHARVEGYFRLEWKLAVDRSHLMTANKAFLLPVVIDDTRDDDEHVPDKFREVQWTRLPEGNSLPAFVERVLRLLSPETSTAAVSQATALPRARPALVSQLRTPSRPISPLLAILGAVILGAIAYFAIDKLWTMRGTSQVVASPTSARTGPVNSPSFSPPPHSIAVLPFVNMSGDKEQEYFSDGLTEEILNSLARINELQVSARTSSFYFKGKDADLSTIAHKLNVASVLEGSVRRSGHTVRVTAQLNNAVTGFHLWSQTYDRNLSDVLRLQTEIANAVADALKVTLLGNVAAKIEVGGTRNPKAFDAYLRASKGYRASGNATEMQAAIAGYTEAIGADPNYALAYADRSLAHVSFATLYAKGSDVRDYHLNKAQSDAHRAVAIATNLGEGHLALANVAENLLDFTGASREYQRALALEPGNARLLKDYGGFAIYMGQTEAGLAAMRRSVVLDPLNAKYHRALGYGLFSARRYPDAILAHTSVKALDPSETLVNQDLGLVYYASGDLLSARAACESPGNEFLRPYCLALVYEKLGRHADAKTMFAKLQATWGDTPIVYTAYAVIDAQWGNTGRALDWLETALRNRDPYLAMVKRSPLLDPLRKEPRFQAIERELKFPK